MQRTLFLLLLITAAACGGRKQGRHQETSEPGRDTLANVPDTALYDFSLRDTSIRIAAGGSFYKLKISVQLMRQKPFFIEFGNEAADVEAYAGFDAAYSFDLKRESGEQVFSTTFTKEQFRNIGDGSCVAMSDARIPRFEGYLPGFKAFAFTISFWVPDSDLGQTCLILLDEKGKMTENCSYNFCGGGGGAGEGVISPTLPFILTCNQIIHADGRKVDLMRDNADPVGVFLINPNTVLVVREYDEKSNPENAVLMGINGKKVQTFTYNGYYETLDYNVPMALDAAAGCCYLLDEGAKLLTIIPQNNPEAWKQAHLDDLKVFDGKKKPNEVVTKVDTEAGIFTIYTDTITSLVRYKSSIKNGD